MKKLDLKQFQSALDKPAWILCGLIFLCVIIYGQILFAPFVYDDHELLLASPLIKSLYAPFQNWLTASTKVFTYFTFAVNFAIGGKNPFGYHFVNVILHGLNSWFLYLFVLSLHETPLLKENVKHKNITALIASLIFLVHPLQTQAVSHIWQRSELLNGFFYLLTLLFYIKGRLNPGRGYFLYAALFFVIGFYSKGMIVSLPLLILLIEDIFFDKSTRKRLFLWACALFLVLAKILFWRTPVMNRFRTPFLLALSTLTGSMLSLPHLCTQLEVIARYIGLTILPVYQNLDHTIIPAMSFWNTKTLLAFFFIADILFLGIYFWKRNKLLSLGIFWFFLALLPSSLLGGREPMVEHRLYVSIAGFALCFASLVQYWNKHAKVITACFIIFLSIFTLMRNHLWSSPQLLFEDTLRKSPKKARPAVMLGTVYLVDGNLQDAHRMYLQALQNDPRSAESYNNLGVIYLQTGQTMRAEEMFEKAIKARADFAPAYVNLGYFALSLGDNDRAAALFKKAVALGRKDVEPALKRALPRGAYLLQ